MNVARVLAVEDVQTDLDYGEQFYNAREPGVGEYFRDSIIVDIESLRLFAGVHAKHFDCYRMLASRFPFAIYYDIQGATTIVIAVLDMRRNLSTIRRTLKTRNR